MIVSVILLIVSLGLILLASIVFTNGIEQLGQKLNMHQGAVGSILAAVGTALPETVIPIIAILVYHGDEKAHEVGIGAIAGAPFMLGTLAFFVTGLAVLVYTALGKRSAAMHIHPEVLTRDLTFFIVLYGLAILTTFAHDVLAVKVCVAIVLLAAYGWYVRRTLIAEGAELEEPEPLFLSRLLKVRSRTAWVSVQVIASLVLMVFGAHMFVGYTEEVSVGFGVSALILSIIITPVATELPEKFNSVIWVGKKKDVLALGNITGAMVFQSSFPVVFGVVFTHWDLRRGHGETLVSAVLALASALLVLAWVKIKKTLNPYVLMAGGAFYGIFILYLVLR